MDWSLDKNKARTRKIRPFEAVGALGTPAAAKAPRGLDGLPKQKSWKSFREIAQGGLPKTTENTMERSGLLPHSQVSWLVTKRVQKGCG